MLTEIADNRGINFAFSFMLFNDYKCLRLASPENTSHVIAHANDELSILVAFPSAINCGPQSQYPTWIGNDWNTWMNIGGMDRRVERACHFERD